MTIETLGIDIAKNVFQLHGVNRAGRLILRRRVTGDPLLHVLAQTEPCTVAVGACTGAFCWRVPRSVGCRFVRAGKPAQSLVMESANPAPD